MTLRFASATAFALIAATCVSPARADTGYQPYYDTRDSIQFADVQVPTSSVSAGTPSVPIVSAPGQAAPWQAPRETVADGGYFFGVPQDWSNEPLLFHYNNAVWVSGGASFFNFKEQTPPGSSERGWLPSIAAGASYMNHYNTYFALDGSANFGNTTYRGPNGATPFVTAQHDDNSTVYTANGKLGQGFYVAPNVMLIPYADVGYRHWKFDNNGSGQIAYLHNFAVMGGLMAEVSPIPQLVLTGYGAGGTTLGARAESNINSDAYSLGDAGIYDVGGKAAFFMTPRVEVFTTFDYTHFHYGSSSADADGTAFPSSQTNDTTVRVGLGYHFR